MHWCHSYFPWPCFSAYLSTILSINLFDLIFMAPLFCACFIHSTKNLQRGNSIYCFYRPCGQFQTHIFKNFNFLRSFTRNQIWQRMELEPPKSGLSSVWPSLLHLWWNTSWWFAANLRSVVYHLHNQFLIPTNMLHCLIQTMASNCNMKEKEEIYKSPQPLMSFHELCSRWLP